MKNAGFSSHQLSESDTSKLLHLLEENRRLKELYEYQPVQGRQERGSGSTDQLIGALAILFAELVEKKARPLPRKQLILNGAKARISADALKEIIVTRFPDTRLNTCNRKISQGLKSIGEYEK